MSALSIHPLEHFRQFIAPPVRLAALDIGTRTIGIALSTPDWQMATPLTTIMRGKWSADLVALEKAFDGYGIGGLIVGLPLNMDDSEGPRAQGVRQVVYNLIKAEPSFLSGCLAAFVDERLSSAHAVELTAQHRRLGQAKASGALDAVAAQIILERALTILREPDD